VSLRGCWDTNLQTIELKNLLDIPTEVVIMFYLRFFCVFDTHFFLLEDVAGYYRVVFHSLFDILMMSFPVLKLFSSAGLELVFSALRSQITNFCFIFHENQTIKRRVIVSYINLENLTIKYIVKDLIDIL